MSSYSIKVNHDTCIKCGKCIKVCPVKIFTQSSADKEVNSENIKTCIACGHCVAVCPSDSIQHSEFPASKVHKIDYENMPSPDQVMLLCKARRSNRAFSKKPVPGEYLRQIVEAAHRAPTASNIQDISFMLITDPDKLKLLSEFTLKIFTDAVSKLENPVLKPFLKRIMPDAYKYVPTFKALKEQYDGGNDMIMRGATAALIIYPPKGSRFGLIDANLAYQNGSLMAESLGVSQFYMGFVYSATQQSGGSQLAKELGIDGDIHAGMALAMPAFRFPNYIDKKDLNLKEL